MRFASYIARSAATCSASSSLSSGSSALHATPTLAVTPAGSLGADGHSQLADRLHQVDREDLRTLPARAREEHRELVAPQPRGYVRVPDPLRDHLGHAPQDLVAGGVPDRVVDLLEAVEVDHQQRGLAPVAALLGELAGEMGADARR